MERASKVIGKLRLPGETFSDEDWASAAWPAAVGKRIAVHTRVLKMVRDTLVIEVEDAVWQRQLFVLRRQVVEKLRSHLGRAVVKDIEFRVAPRRFGPQRAGHITEPTVRATAGPLFDEADGIEDPMLRRIYKASRRKALA